MKKKSRVKNKQKELVKIAERSLKTHLIYNFILILSLTGLLVLAYFTIPSYRLVFESKIFENNKFILANMDLSVEQKLAIRLGKDYSYTKLIAERTPEDAILLFPPSDKFQGSMFNQKGAWGLKDVTWATYFLYPRKILNENITPKDQSILDSYNYVMIMGDWGYDKIDMKISKRNKPFIIPRHRRGVK